MQQIYSNFFLILVCKHSFLYFIVLRSLWMNRLPAEIMLSIPGYCFDALRGKEEVV